MAAKKDNSKSKDPTPKPTAEAEPSSEPKKTPKLAKQHISALKALGADYAEPLDRRVAEVLYETRELEAVLEKLGKELMGKSLLTAEMIEALPVRRKVLETAEDLWSREKSAAMSGDQKELRKEAERLKRDIMAALRYFLRNASNGAEIEKRLDAIAEGTGLADLVSDLRQLSGLVEEHEAALSKADLPKKAASRALSLSDALSGSVKAYSDNDEAQKAIDLRNRAFWWLRDVVDEVRAAGRYVYRDHPKKLALFRPAQKRRSPAKKPAEGPKK